MVSIILLMMCVLVATVSGQIESTGNCSSVTNKIPVSAFNLTRYAGTWYEVSRYPGSEPLEEDCAVSTSVTNTTTRNNIVRNTVNLFTRARSAVNGYVVLDSPLANPILGLININQLTNELIQQKVLHTDYDNYAIVYSCKDGAAQNKSESVWVLSRTQIVSPDVQTVIDANLMISNITKERLRPVEHDSYICGEDTACSQGLAPVINAFKATEYLGEWYEISRLEKSFQTDGDCVTANYVAVPDKSLAVINTLTMLSNMTSRTVIGTAKIANANGNPLLGLLSVSFNETGTPTNAEYRIMSTDYNTYSVVYSCSNVKGAVTYGSAWILSRNRTLDASSEAFKVIQNNKNAIDITAMRKTEQDEKKCNSAPVGAALSMMAAFVVLGRFLLY